MRLAILPRSAASARALLAASSFSRRSFALSSLSSLSLRKISRALTRCAATSVAVTVDLVAGPGLSTMLLRLEDVVDVVERLKAGREMMVLLRLAAVVGLERLGGGGIVTPGAVFS